MSSLMKEGYAVSISAANGVSLTDEDIEKILSQGIAAAQKEESLLRVDAQGTKQTTKMHVAVFTREGELSMRSMPDAWLGSLDIAKAKANTALLFSSNENALTSRTIGLLSQPGQPLWQIGNSNHQQGLIEFPGGIPLYKDGILVGGVGVSGDGVDQDENVATEAASGFSAPEAIRVDTVLGEGLYTK